MNFTQPTGFVHVFMLCDVLWWRSGHLVPTALLQQGLHHPLCPCGGATSTLPLLV